MMASWFREVAVGAIVAAACLSGGCSPQSHSAVDDRLPIFVGVAPLAFVAEQIGGEHVSVGILVQPAQDPHTFDPTPQQIVALSKAKLFFQVGMPFELILVEQIKTGHERLTVVDVTEGISKLAGACEHGLDHAETHEDGDGDEATHGDSEASKGEEEAEGHSGHGGEASHGHGWDPHVWLSPLLLKQIARNMAAAMEKADAGHSQFYSENLNALLKRIDAADEKIRGMLEPYRGRAFYVFHPGFGYFAEAYGLRQVAIEAEGKSPTPKQMQALVKQARQDHAGAVFVQPQSPREAAQVFAKVVGARVVTLDGLAKDVLADLDDIATKVAASMGSSMTK